MKTICRLFLFYGLCYSVVNCSFNTSTQQSIIDNNQIDSITIWYHKENIKPGGLIFEDRLFYREGFMFENANASFTVKDSSVFALLCDLIDKLKPRDQQYVEETVKTRCALVVYRRNSIDTLALSDAPPPEVQTKNDKYIDCISRDSLLCKTVWSLIAQRDTFWLNYCADGRWYKEFWL